MNTPGKRPAAARTARRPGAKVSTGQPKRRQAKPENLVAQHLGYLLPRGKSSVEAYDAAGEHSLGIFSNMKSAADAVALNAEGAS
jgi:hypothetical protein